MRIRALAGVAAAASLVLSILGLASSACAQSGAPAASDGKMIFQQHCQSCHEPAISRAPSRSALEWRPRADILRALNDGVMKPMTAGLSPADVEAVAGFLTPLESLQAGKGGGPAIGTDTLCASHPPLRSGPADWSSLAVDPGSSRFQPHPGLAKADVPRLKLKWSFAMTGGGQPTVVGDWLFITNKSGKFYALDARTGCVHWVVSGVSSRTTPMVIRSRHSPSGWATFIGAAGRIVHAYDAQTGVELWKSAAIDDNPNSVLTGTPVIVGDRIIAPVSSGEEVAATVPSYVCCTFRGALVALDLRTGRILWRTHVINEPWRVIGKNAAGTPIRGPAGGAIWSAPTVDLKRGLVYVGTGDSYTDAPTLGADAVAAVEVATGKVRWRHQFSKGDNFILNCLETVKAVNCPKESGPDYDFGASPILLDLKAGRQVLVIGQKSGVVHGMDPATGRPLWSTRVGAGSIVGGVEWGIATDRRLVFAPNSDLFDLIDEALRPLGKSIVGFKEPGPARPGLTALDPATGRIAWQVPAPIAPCQYHGDRSQDWVPGVCMRAQSAAPAAMPGVVFSGTMDGWIRAYDASAGAILWAYSTTAQTYDTVNGVKDQPGGDIDGMGPTLANGMMFTMSGFNGAGNTGGNWVNVLLAFSVDGR